MTIPERSTIRLRLVGADYPDGEIPLVDVGRIADTAQRLTTRLARSEEGRGGAGRSPIRLADGVRLMLIGMEPGSTQVLIAGPPRQAQLDLGPPSEEAIERILGRLVDGLEASANRTPLPREYDEVSRGSLGELLDALAQAAPEVEMDGRVGARPPTVVRFRPDQAGAVLREAPTPEASQPRSVLVEGVLYAVNLHTGRYRIEDDMGSSIDLVSSALTGEHVAPLLGQRVSAAGRATYDQSGKLKEIDSTTIAPAAPIEGFDPTRFAGTVDLDELVRDASPIESLEELAIPGLSETEIDAFVRSIRD